jgi:hypothetical protein
MVNVDLGLSAPPNFYAVLTILAEVRPFAPPCAEDGSLEEPHLVAAVAAKIICKHGSKSLAVIAEHCRMAIAIGDLSSLQTWRDIAAAIERLLRMDNTLPAHPSGAPARRLQL